MKIFGSLSELVKAVFRKDNKEVTLDVGTQAGTAASRIFRLPAYDSSDNIDDQLAAVTLAQTLSNKTLNSTNLIDGSRADNMEIRKPTGVGGVSILKFYEDESSGSNKISLQSPSALTNDYSFTLPSTPGNGNSSVLVSVNGNATTSWINYGSALGNSTLVQRDNSNNFSANIITATLNGNATNVTGIVAKANGGTGADNSNVTFPNTGTVVTRDATETLLNKTTVSSTELATGALTLPAGTTAEQPGSPVNGMIRYNTNTGSFEGRANGAWSAIGGGGTTDQISSASTFDIGDVLYLNGSTYTKADATTSPTAEVVGIVSRVITLNSLYEITLVGEVSGLLAANFTEAALPAAGEAIFLSTTAGKMTISEPTVIGHVSVPLGVASGSGSMYVSPKRGSVIGGTNARAEVSLADAGSTLVYTPPSGMEAAELQGWVYINGSTKYRFHLSAQFAKNGLDNDWNISYQTTGDTPPAGFAVTIASNGNVSITLPSIGGYSSAKVNYSINGPAVGATFPLTINGDRITEGTVAAARLPVADGSNAGIISTGTQSLAGAKTFTSGIVIGNNATGDANLGTITSVTNSAYYEGSFVANFNNGMNTSTNNVTVKYVRVGKVVTLFFPLTVVTANATADTWNSIGAIPINLRPTGYSYWTPVLLNNNISETGTYFGCGNDGNITFKRSSTWASGTTSCGFQATSCTYLLT